MFQKSHCRIVYSGNILLKNVKLTCLLFHIGNRDYWMAVRLCFTHDFGLHFFPFFWGSISTSKKSIWWMRMKTDLFVMRMKIDNDGTDSLAIIAIFDLKQRWHLAANMFPVSGCKSAGTGCSGSCLQLYLARHIYIFTMHWLKLCWPDFCSWCG